MAKHVFGLASIKIGDIAGDGGMGTSLTAVGETVSGTCVLTTEDNTVVDFTVEETDSPIESVITAGKASVAWSCYNVAGDQLVRFFGGTYTAGPPSTWDAPDAFPDLEVSLEITDKKGNVIAIPRVKLNPKFGLSFTKDKLGQIDITAQILAPTKVAEPRVSITYA